MTNNDSASDAALRRIIREEVQAEFLAALKPSVKRCGQSVLQDSSCNLPWTHTGLHVDDGGVWRCPWCHKDAFWGHEKDCPAYKEAVSDH